ncbi:MAG: hypothetical protein AAGC67_07185, partial [Myxococcota bacterium]
MLMKLLDKGTGAVAKLLDLLPHVDDNEINMIILDQLSPVRMEAASAQIFQVFHLCPPGLSSSFMRSLSLS